MPPLIQDKKLQADFEVEHQDLLLKRTRIALVIALVFVPAGVGMDFFVYPELVGSFLWLRILLELVTLALFAIIFHPFGMKNASIMGLAHAYLATWTFIGMIFLADGPHSPYYGGLVIYTVVCASLIPWTARQSTYFWLQALVLYITACIIHATTGRSLRLDPLLANSFFILIIGIVSSTASHLAWRARVNDFLLRHELDKRNKQLEKLDELKSQFFANVSHELRTPLTLILSPIHEQLMDRNKLPAALRESMETIEQNALRLLKLINELLDLMKLEQGQLRLTVEPVDLSVFIPGLVESLRYLAERKRISIEFGECDNPMVVRLDPARVEKVVLNLLSNAIKYTPAGGRISVQWNRHGDNAQIDIRDTGIGIPAAELENIFQRFYQVNGSSTRQAQGVGVGLALAREIVQMHGGDLDVDSIQGEGSSFHITLPVNPTIEETTSEDGADTAEDDPFQDAFRAANRAISAPPDAEEPGRIIEPVGDGPHEILVVDDEPDMLRYLTRILSRDHRVHPVSTGSEALKSALEKKPNLLVLDWMLPGLSGLEVCRAVREKDPSHEMKVLILTARVDEESKIKALSQGADDFLTKPFSATELSTRVRNLLHNSDLQRDLRDKNQELKETLNQLQETEAILVQSEKMNALGNLAAGLLHEINNPLNIALTAVDFAKQIVPPDDPDLVETMDDVQECMNRINNIVSDLHTFAHPKKEYANTPFNVKEAVESALNLGAHNLKQVEIKLDIDDNLRALGSQPQITHVLLNFLLNSATAVQEKHRDTGGGLIEITARQEGERIFVSVRDNGIGIPADAIKQIFDPFFTTRKVGEGMGLGLSISHTIVKNHDGRLTAESKPGEWTEITFDLAAECLEKVT